MTSDEQKRLKALFIATAMYYDQKIPDAVLQLYVNDLDDLPISEVERTIGELRRDPKTTRCPLPAIIRARLTPESNPESEAILLASRIAGCVSRIGPYQTAMAKLELGPVAWQVVQMEGGWESLCQNVTYDNLGMLKAQWRNVAKALIERGGSNETRQALTGPVGTQNKIDFGRLLKSIPKGNSNEDI